MIDARSLMRLHVEALFTRDAAGRLFSVNDREGAPAPRFFLGRTDEGNLWWFRGDVGPDLARDLDALCESQPTGLEVDAALFVARLAREAPVHRTWAGPVFRFPSDLREVEHTLRVTPDNAAVLSPYLEDWRDDVPVSVPMVVMLEGGKAVSLCASVRVTPQAHEAGVETHGDFRGRGYAAQTVAAWARAVRDLDRIPLYSTSWENDSSRAVANKLGLIQFGADLHVT